MFIRKTKASQMGRLLLTFSMCLLTFTSGFGQGRSPQGRIGGSGKVDVLWENNGAKSHLDGVVKNGEYFLPVEEIAQLSESQLRWQNVSQQACLSRKTGLLCFNWERNQIALNGREVGSTYSLIHEENQLFVPMTFVSSKDFEDYAESQIKWNPSRARLIQSSPVTLDIPPVENLGDRYRLAFSVPETTPYHLLQDRKNRVWMRFVRGRTEGSQVLEGDNVIKEIRIVQRKRSADLILTLGPDATSRDVYFDKGINKLTIDVFRKGGGSSSSGGIVPIVPKSTRKKSIPVAKRKDVVPAKDPGVRTIVIDAGHGGVDPGAIGTRGTFEKDINLKAAKLLADFFSKSKDTRVILTRDTDVFLTLSERTEIANKAKADIFISVHCNSSLSAKSHGFEVYILSPDASDEAAAAVARMENSVVTLETKNQNDSSRLSQLLASMAIYDFINESSKAAAYICRGVKARSGVDKTGVKEANFHVLRGAQMPGVLVEMGYLSNPVSELKLRSSRHLGQLARGIVEGVDNFLSIVESRAPAISNQNRKSIRKAKK